MHPQVLHFFKICSEVGSHHKSHAQGQCHATGHSKTERFFWWSAWTKWRSMELVLAVWVSVVPRPWIDQIAEGLLHQWNLSNPDAAVSYLPNANHQMGLRFVPKLSIKGVYYFFWCFNVWIRFLFELFPHKAQGCPNELRRTWSHHLGEWGLWTSDRCGSSTHVPCLV